MKRFFTLLVLSALVIGLLTMPATAEQTTLSFLSWQNETVMQPIIDAFQAANPDIKIDFIYAPPVNDYLQKFRMMVTSGELPDIFVTCAENKAEVMDNNLAKDLSSMAVMSRLSNANKNTYTASNGSVVAFAPDAWIAGIFYNEKLLSDNSISVPANYKEYMDSMAKLKAAGVQPWVFHKGNLYDPLQGYVATETIAKDASFDAKANAGELKYADGWSKPLELWNNDYVKNGYIPEESLGLDGDQALDAFINGHAAYTIGATWVVSTIDQKNPDMKYGMLPWFGVDSDEKWCTGAAGVGWSINSASKHPDEAQKFLDFLASDDTLKQFQQLTGGLLAISGIDYPMHPVIAMCKDELQSGKFYLPAVAWKYSGALGDVMLTGTQEVVMGTRDAASIAMLMDDKFAELEAASK